MCIERLESRTLLNAMPVGPEFRINTYTANDQRTPSIAADTDGDFVVAWTSDGQDGSSYGVYAQRFDASGVPQGGEISVNTFTTNRQQNASVAMDSSGDFVVAWESLYQDGSVYGVYARRFDAAGMPQGGEIIQGDFNYDGQVNLLDFNILASRFNTALAADGIPDQLVRRREP